MRLASYFAYGTGAYPEKVARRLRVVNVTALFIAASMALFQVISPGPPDPLTVAVMLGNAAVPLLHRFGSAAAPLALVALAWVHVSRIILEIGTGDGIFLAFVSAAPMSILLLGSERLWLAAIVAATSAAIALVLHLTVPVDTGVVTPSETRINFILNLTINAAVLFLIVAYVVRIAERAEAAAERERVRSDRLLTAILPKAVAERLKDAPGQIIADRYEAASVLFADMAGFTARAAETTPEVLVAFLNRVFGNFDAIVARHGLEKIKTLGDGYMVVSGIPTPRPDHAEALARCALELRGSASAFVDPAGNALSLRIGMASGPVVAGVVGTLKFFYDVWGDAVNMAARMEATGEPGRIHVAPEMARQLSGGFRLEERGPIEVKGKGMVTTAFLEAGPPLIVEPAAATPTAPAGT